MVSAERVSINIELPKNEVSVVTMHPALNLVSQEPYKIHKTSIDEQLSSIERTLQLAQDYLFGKSAHFTIFPEYSIPVEGIELIDQKMISKDWSNGSVIIAGVHGLSKEEFQEVLNNYDIKIDNRDEPKRIPDDRWINCCFIWVKEADGKIRRFIQLKVRPSWPENDVSCNDMHCGTNIFVFECNFQNENQVPIPCRFTTFICFDWVATIGSNTVRDEMLSSLQDQVRPHETSIHWIFVIQYNRSPNHTSFLNSTVNFISDPNQDFPLIRRNESVILHINTAAKKAPAKLEKELEGAFSACILPPIEKIDCNGCRPTICMQPHHFRGSNILKQNQLKDIVFREVGECVHRFKIRVPRFLKGGAENRTHPLTEAEVHSLKESNDPRTSGRSIPASIKWLNDSLDTIEPLSQRSLNKCKLSDIAASKQIAITKEMRLLEGKKIENQINWTTCKQNDRKSNPDLWYLDPSFEMQSLEHTLYTLTNIGIAYDIEIGAANFHGAIDLDDKYIQIITVKGKSYEECRSHYDDQIPKESIDPVIIVFKDKDGYKPTKEEYRKFYEVDVESGENMIDYNTLLNFSRDAESIQQLKDRLDEYVSTDRKFI